MASVRRRPGTDKNGQPYGWQVRWIDPATGKRPSETFKLKKDADAFLRKVEREIEDGVHISKDKAVTVAEVCRRYVEAAEAREQRREIGACRLIQINIMVDKHIVPRIGEKLFHEVGAAEIDRLYNTMTKDVSPFYARMIVSNLATIERWASRQGFVKTALITSAVKGIRGVKPPRIEEFTTEQLATILSHVLKRSAPRRRYAALVACFVHLAACCGLRLGEISALDRDSILLDRKLLRIRRNRTVHGEVKGPKSAAGNRDVPIPDHLCEMLTRWLDSYYEQNEGGFVFTTYTGQPIAPTNIRHGWHVVLKECGLYREGAVFHFHALRHFSGSWWLDNGMPIQDVALQLGHASASTTLAIYAHTVSKVASRQAAMTQMGRLLLPATDTSVTHELANA